MTECMPRHARRGTWEYYRLATPRNAAALLLVASASAMVALAVAMLGYVAMR